MLYAFYRHACQANGGTLLAQSRNAPTAQLEATARDQNGNAMSAQFSWASSDTAVVTVDRTGLVTARGNGTVTITARSGELSGTATVQVLQRVRHFRSTPARLSLDPVLFTSIGETVQFTAQALDSNRHVISEATFTASPRESGVVSIDDKLLATAIDNGDTVIDFTTQWAGNATAWSISEATFTASPRESGVVSIDDKLLATAIDNGDTVIDFTTQWAGNATAWSNPVRVRQVDPNFVERMEAHYPGRIEELSESFDNEIYPAVSDLFGAPDLGNMLPVRFAPRRLRRSDRATVPGISARPRTSNRYGFNTHWTYPFGVYLAIVGLMGSTGN